MSTSTGLTQLIVFLFSEFSILEAQVNKQKDDAASGFSEVAGKKSRVDVSPGVSVFGKKNRFSAVGPANGFDISPEGEALVFAAAKVVFFDLKENKITASVGESNSGYEHIAYSRDGRTVFASARGARDVELFDSIEQKRIDRVSFDGFEIEGFKVSADTKFVAAWGAIASYRCER